MKVLRIDHLVITVKNIEQTIWFYGEILGMEMRQTNGRWEVRFGQQKINFHQEKGEFHPAAQNPEYGCQDICFIIEGDLKEIREEVESKGVTVIEGIVKRNGFLGSMDSIYIRDPDGNLIELSIYKHC